MVITDVPFDARTRGKTSRYSLIRRPGSSLQTDSDDEDAAARESKEYAAFIK